MVAEFFATSVTSTSTCLAKEPPLALLLTMLLRVASSSISLRFLFISLLIFFLYNLLDFHVLRDLLRGCRGDHVGLTSHPSSHIYRDVASKCKTLRDIFRRCGFRAPISRPRCSASSATLPLSTTRGRYSAWLTEEPLHWIGCYLLMVSACDPSAFLFP